MGRVNSRASAIEYDNTNTKGHAAEGSIKVLDSI
jgi:hypothetical protein